MELERNQERSNETSFAWLPQGKKIELEKKMRTQILPLLGDKKLKIKRWKLTVSNSGFPLHLATASQKRTAALSTGSAGNCHARSSICVDRSGVDAGMS